MGGCVLTDLTGSCPGASAPEAFAEARFLDPLGFIREEHRRQEELCAVLEGLVDDFTKPSSRDKATGILAYLTEELPLHEQDEEEGLIPLLQARCGDAEAQGLLSRLRGQHADDRARVATLIADLDALYVEVPLGDPGAFVLNALMLAETWRRHLAWENQVLLPLARDRLNAADLEELGRAMAARRGAAFPGSRVARPGRRVTG